MRVPRAAPPAPFWRFALATFAIDWATKLAARAMLDPRAPRQLIGDALRLTLAYDSRHTFWFGIPGTPYIPVPGGVVSFYVVKIVVLLVMVRLASRAPARIVPAFGILFGAGLGNTLEGLVTGAVTNFLDAGAGVHRWPTFNLADAALVTTGLALALLLSRDGWRLTP